MTRQRYREAVHRRFRDGRSGTGARSRRARRGIFFAGFLPHPINEQDPFVAGSEHDLVVFSGRKDAENSAAGMQLLNGISETRI
jgi:hypothetical protein